MSKIKVKYLGTFGDAGCFSFAPNKIITTGGGGMIITNDSEIAEKAKHLSTTAKIDHQFLFNHDAIGYNYRLPNINAALGCAQMENLDVYLDQHRQMSEIYKDYFKDTNIDYIDQPLNSESNHWLNAILLDNEKDRDAFLKEANKSNIMLRPPWTLMHNLAMYKDCNHDSLENTINLSKRILNIPSSCRETEV